MYIDHYVFRLFFHFIIFPLCYLLQVEGDPGVKERVSIGDNGQRSDGKVSIKDVYVRIRTPVYT